MAGKGLQSDFFPEMILQILIDLCNLVSSKFFSCFTIELTAEIRQQYLQKALENNRSALIGIGKFCTNSPDSTPDARRGSDAEKLSGRSG